MLRQGGISYAIERIQFQKESALFRDLTEIYQDALGRLDDKFAETKPTSRQVFDVLDKAKTGEKLTQIAIKHLNLTLRVLFLSDASLNVMVLTNMQKNKDLFTEFSRRHGLSEGKRSSYTSPDKAAKDIIRELGETVNIEKGQHGDPAASDLYGFKLIMTTGLFDKHAISQNIERFTAKELAAITLHELGHMILLPYDAQKTFRSATIIQDAFEYLRSESVSNKDRKDAALRIANKVHDIYGVKKNKKQTDLMPKEDIDETQASIADIKKGLIATIGKFAVIVFLYTLFHYIMTHILSALLGRIATYGHERFSDDGMSYKDGTVHERSADEFSTRHGAGLHLVSALHKVGEHNLFEHHKVATSPSASISAANLANWVLTVLPRIFSSAASEASAFFPYEASTKRLERILETNMAFFKQTNIPKDVMKEWIQDTQDLKEKIDEIKKRPHIKYHATIRRVVQELNASQNLDRLRDANLEKDLDALQDATSGLIRNPFYYQSARLKHR